MRSYPDMTDEHDRKDVERMAPEPWMLEPLKLNPSYCSWGPHEDYMCDKKAGWAAPVFHATWAAGPPSLDDLNEVVNFYFSVERDDEQCSACEGSGYNSETKRISDSFYRHSSPTGEYWSDKITQAEVDYLIGKGRLTPGATAEDVNAANGYAGPRKGHFFLMHDAINRMYLIERRANLYGVYGHCAECDGQGYIYTSPTCRLALTLWVLHPRKGCSRGWEIASIEKKELGEVYAYLAEAARRNADRFSKVVEMVR